METAANSQITDAVTEVNTKVLGDAPALAMGNLLQATAQALSLAAMNATNAQQHSNITAQATTVMGITTLYSVDSATAAAGVSDIIKTMPGGAEAGTPVPQNDTNA